MTAPALEPPRDGDISYRFVVGVDLEGFSRLNAREQKEAQHDLRHALNLAAARSGLDRGQWALQPSGDGEMAFLPAEVGGVRLVWHYPRALRDALHEINRGRRGRDRARVRVRMAIHHGVLADGFFGPVGDAPILTARLLDSDVLREELRTARWDLALMVSERVHDDIVRSGLHGVESAHFHRVDVTSKNGTHSAYVLRLPRKARRRGGSGS